MLTSLKLTSGVSLTGVNVNAIVEAVEVAVLPEVGPLQVVLQPQLLLQLRLR